MILTLLVPGWAGAGPIRFFISAAIVIKACSTFVAFLALVSKNGIPRESAYSYREKCTVLLWELILHKLSKKRGKNVLTEQVNNALPCMYQNSYKEGLGRNSLIIHNWKATTVPSVVARWDKLGKKSHKQKGFFFNILVTSQKPYKTNHH